jgi:membrane glycosyltransferase
MNFDSDGSSTSLPMIGGPVSNPNTPAWRALLWLATLATVAPLTWVMAEAISSEARGLEIAVLVLFVILTTWIALWFWIATTGFWRAWRRGSPGDRGRPDYGDWRPTASTAILLPVYNEEPREVFARIRAMLSSLAETGMAEHFDVFVLSDSTNADVWLDEEWHWLQLREELARPVAVNYRRRSQNLHRKAGNIQDFCERWGAGYPLMVVLDADSLMDGRTLVELVRRMEADPQLGLLQSPPLPLGDRSLLARGQQFASKLCGNLLAEGLDWYSGDGGNYWGHNAIMRTAVFTHHCGLSHLPGKAPLGGEVLSHDFVEAALIQRAGYKVRMACDLAASYEQSPTTLPAYAQREQRWCQGNLQHARLVLSRRIGWSNRFHFATGVLAYTTAPMWLAFLTLSACAWLVSSIGSLHGHTFRPGQGGGVAPLTVFAMVMGMLITPRLYGVMLAARRGELRGYGGALRLAMSLGVELFVSVLMAPIMMAFHSLFVISTLRGRKVEWKAQQRSDDGITLRQAWQVHRGQTITGVVMAVLVALLLPEALAWLSPVYVGLILSAPISVALSSARLGDWLKRHGLLRVPEETDRPPVVRRFELEVEQEERGGHGEIVERADLFRRVIDDPQFLRAHVANLRATNEVAQAPRPLVHNMAPRVANNAWAKVTNEEKRTVLLDPRALAALQRLVWRKKSPPLESSLPL